jgi:hypothetical protein
VSPRDRRQIEAPGQDSFLDVVCNLVGILIILVMLVAATAKREMIAAALGRPSDEDRPAVGSDELQAAQSAAGAIQRSVHELQVTIDRQKLEAALRQQEREKYQLLVTIAQQRLAEHRDQLSSEERERYDLEQQIAASKNELARLENMQVSLTRTRPKVLEHLPTPMARTVFGTEIHFRLQGGRLAYVPWDEMLERMKADAPNHVPKLRDAPRVELSLPVINGFGARYILRRADLVVHTRLGPARQGAIELEKLYFVDAEPRLGQSVADAVLPGSELRTRLAAHKPQATTVTIWVYPDGFDDFRTIKAELFKLGYLTAARPMPAGHPIGGSPDGTRSVAE